LAWAQLRERKHGERERRMEIERENISVGEREKTLIKRVKKKKKILLY
jgi:hypothetical protein